MDYLILIIATPIALVMGLLVCACFAVGFYVMMNVYKAGKDPSVDYSNYLGRLLGWVQTTRHIPKLMKTIFVWGQGEHGITILDLPPGRYEIANQEGTKTVVDITRPLQNMQAQDLMEQMGFRPDDGRVT